MTQLSLGSFLSQERKKQGFSLEQISAETKIQIRTLEALEADDFDALPAKPFVHGFLKAYAQALNISTQKLFHIYQKDLETKLQGHTQPSHLYKGYAFERKVLQKSRFLLIFSLGIFFCSGALLWFLIKPHRIYRVPATKKITKILPQKKKPTKLKQVSTAVSPSPSTSALKSTPSIKEKKSILPDPLRKGDSLLPTEIKYRVIFHALESVWIRYRVDQRKVMQFILKKGNYLILKAQKNLVLQIADPASLEYRYQKKGFLRMDREKKLFSFQNKTLHIPYLKKPPALSPFPKHTPLPTLLSTSALPNHKQPLSKARSDRVIHTEPPSYPHDITN